MRILSHQRFHQLHHPAEDFRLGEGCAGGVGYYEVEGFARELRAADLEACAAAFHHIFQMPAASWHEGEQDLGIPVCPDKLFMTDGKDDQLYPFPGEIALHLIHCRGGILRIGIEEHGHLGDVREAHQRRGILAPESANQDICGKTSHLPSLSVP